MTPRSSRCAIAAGCARPAYVPRSSSGTPGCSFVKPLTCSSYITESASGVAGWRSSPQSNGAAWTTERGTNGAESRSSWAVTAGSHVTSPSMPRA